MPFVGSRPFLVSGLVALALLVAGVAAYAADRATLGDASQPGCDAPRFAADHDVAPSRVESGTVLGHARRTVTFDLPGVANATAGLLDACTVAGDVDVRPSPDAMAHVVFTITASTGAAADATDVRVALATTDAGAQLGAWQARVGRSPSLFGMGGASADLLVEVPPMRALDANVTTTTGDVAIARLLAGNVSVRSTTGDVTLTAVDLAGNLTAGTTTGDLDVDLASVQTCHLDLRSRTGDVTLDAPPRADVGYDATADSTTGDVTVHAGATELDERGTGHSGGHEHARTQGFAQKPTQVVVDATATTGDVTLTLA
jgi:Putative adhesin